MSIGNSPFHWLKSGFMQLVSGCMQQAQNTDIDCLFEGKNVTSALEWGYM